MVPYKVHQLTPVHRFPEGYHSAVPVLAAADDVDHSDPLEPQFPGEWSPWSDNRNMLFVDEAMWSLHHHPQRKKGHIYNMGCINSTQNWKKYKNKKQCALAPWLHNWICFRHSTFKIYFSDLCHFSWFSQPGLFSHALLILQICYNSLEKLHK